MKKILGDTKFMENKNQLKEFREELISGLHLFEERLYEIDPDDKLDITGVANEEAKKIFNGIIDKYYKPILD